MRIRETLRDKSALAILCFLAFLIALVPLLRFGPFGFGYDTGLYRRYVTQPVVAFPNTPVPGLDHTVFVPRIVLDLVHLIVSDPDILLFGTQLLLAVAAVISVFFFSRSYVRRSAWIATSLYVASGIQFLSYNAFLFKQLVAVPLFLGTIVLFDRKRYVLGALLGVLVVISHQTSSILLLLILGAGFLLRSYVERTLSMRYVLATTVIAASYLYLHPHVARKIASPPVSVFLGQTEYLLLALPLLLLAVLGIVSLWRLRALAPVLISAIAVCSAFVVFHLPFYSRVYVFLDLLLVIPAALGVLELWRRFPKYQYVSTAVLAALVMLPLAYTLYTQAPTVDTKTQESLRTLRGLDGAIITSPELMPWVHGWSQLKVHAPGLLKEPHTLSEWERYWAHDSDEYESAFLRTFSTPLYIVAREQEAEYLPACVERLSERVYRVCN